MRKLFSVLFALMFLLSDTIIACAMPQEAQDIKVKSFDFTQDCEYIEILMQLSEDSEDYTAYNEANMKKYSFDTKELSEYHDDDGYISLSAHTDGVVETTLNVNTYDDTKAEKNNGIYLQIADKKPASLADINALKNKFEKFKAAYIDEKGNVLGVTDEFEVTYADEQYAFKAEGSKLTLVMNNYTETVKITLLTSFGFPVIIFIAVLIAVFAAALLFCLLAAKKNKAMMNDMDDDL